MIREIATDSALIKYDLQYKKVKNINLRIKPDGTVCVSANRHVSPEAVDAFVLSKIDFIINALEKYKKMLETPRKQYFKEDEICSVITEFCKKAYPYYARLGIDFPHIKFRKMISRWGSCQPKRNILTFNINLMYAPKKCVEYVVWHEFTHFLQANHSGSFYRELEKVCPDWRESRKILREVRI